MGHFAGYYPTLSAHVHAGLSGPQMEAFDAALESDPVNITLIASFMIGLLAGTIVIFTGLRRARRVPLWAVLAAVVFVVAANAEGIIAGVVGLVAMLVAFTPAALSLVAGPPADRLHPPVPVMAGNR